MTKKENKMFEEIIAASAKYVKDQKGIWDHEAWSKFITDVEKTGYKTSDDVKTSIGSVLESMKLFYMSSMNFDGVADAVVKLSDHSVDFIKKTGGTWSHTDWEAYIKDVQKSGLKLNDEMKSYAGGLLESAKKLSNAAFPMPSFEAFESKGKSA